MLFHPASIIFIAVIFLLLFHRHDKIFNMVAIAFPLVTLVLFYYTSEITYFEIFNIKLIYNFNAENKLIGYAFILVLLSANLYAIGQNKKTELIAGSSYGGSSFLALLADDFISIIIGLELIMVFSSILIFSGRHRQSIRAAKKYFITHLLSGNMIIIGIAYLITKHNSTEILPLTNLMNDPNYSSIILTIMLVGMTLNIAAFPFSGWMVNYYPQSSPTGFIYLILFTTKLSIMLMVKLFAGYEILKYIAIIMIIYSSYKALFEDKILCLLCHLSIIAMGVMMIGISWGSSLTIKATIIYLFIHIIYKLLLSTACAVLIDQGKISLCSEISKIKTPIISGALILGIIVMVGMPLTTGFYAKIIISSSTDIITYSTIILAGIVTVAALPLRQYFLSENKLALELNCYNKSSIYLTGITLILVAFFAPMIPYFSAMIAEHEISLSSSNSTKQIAIIIGTIAIAYLLNIKRKISKSLSSTEFLGDVFFYLYGLWLGSHNKKQEFIEKETWSMESLEQQIMKKISAIHNQQTAIFIVFVVFLVMLFQLIRN